MTEPAPAYVFDRQGRSWGALLVVLAIWAALLAGWTWLDASPVVLGAVALFTLPALWDFWRNPRSGLRLGDGAIRWYSGRRQGHVDLCDLDRVRFDTRLDLSVRITLILTSGRKIRLPYEASPPHRAFEEALNRAGIRSERHHFTLSQ